MIAAQAGLILVLAIVVGAVLLLRHLHHIDDRTRAELARRDISKPATRRTDHG